MTRGFPALAAALVCAAVWLSGEAWAAGDDPAPERATGFAAERPAVQARRHMVAAANPLAAAAGLEILRAGGSAVDAAVAVQMVLGLVEPQSSGIGGGALLVYYDAAGHKVTTFDGRETAPAAARPDRFVGADGKPLTFRDAVQSGMSVGVPGAVRLLATAQARYGKLPWERLFRPAIQLAEGGFPVSPRLHGLLSKDEGLHADPQAAAYFFAPDGKPWPVGTLLKNPDYARVLVAIGDEGDSAFYQGKIAADIVAKVRSHPRRPGDLSTADIAAYQVIERPPVCGNYRSYRICGMGPPSSGGIAVLQMLGVLSAVPFAASAPMSADSVHWLTEAGRLAFADRARYLADPGFVAVPVAGLLDPYYNRSRARSLTAAHSIGKATAGTPPWRQGAAVTASPEAVEHGTSHVAIVDDAGNAVSMTTTIEDAFGSRQMVDGFLLNNELTDFTFEPAQDGQPVANRVEPGKRPRSSMAPTLVFDAHGRLYAVVGSPGGSAIINYVAKTLVALLDWNLDPQQAVASPNIGSRNGPTELEAGTPAAALAEALKQRGHDVKIADATSGTQAIVIKAGALWGGADPRREGVALGD